MRTFRWKSKPDSHDLAPHELRVTKQSGGIKVILVLRKTSPQTLVLNIISDMAEEDFQEAWERQAGWQQTATENVGGKFFCIRYIEFGNNTFCVWRVEHIADEPYDLLDMFQGSLTEVVQFYLT